MTKTKAKLLSLFMSAALAVTALPMYGLSEVKAADTGTETDTGGGYFRLRLWIVILYLGVP